MQRYRLPFTDLEVSRLAYGCMHIGGGWDQNPPSDEHRRHAASAFDAALELGINLFDHADIYTLGKSEQVFGSWLAGRSSLRDGLVVQTKCGIRFAGEPHPISPKRYDFSYDHIVASVEKSLRQLQTDYLDLLLLHRPDPLMEPEEVARAFDHLQGSGKVRYFGVSNHTAGQIALLQHHVRQPLVVNQLEFSLSHSYLVDEGVGANRIDARSALASGTFDYCRLHGLKLQAWSPLGGGRLCRLDGHPNHESYLAASLVADLARVHHTSAEAIVLAWLLRHPAAIQPVVGTTNIDRLRACAQADEVTLSREEWYRLWVAARAQELP